ncbi:molybdenum cofactor guanylyltransferase [Leekyejoonella antrihumi]|uniref:Molybdenum cofactor guanylyltransferase n=1 Tax=Leekyejoonella antrihumi TaxID=1660198 RepID=A0A563DW84_9MICO|nr:NTP transferase domain-containing protein [Leekyejoonella antrihumi]TWP34202.1 molybdenum cofactor guanylyltransferase [Leekyejoonella antrihumi]
MSAGLDGMTCVVLCGGTSRRFGGGDKTAAAFGPTTVLGHLLSELPSDLAVICVGDERPTPRPVTWMREDPPHGGPVAAIAAALERIDSALVAVIAGDMPYAARGLAALRAALADAPAPASAVAVDSHGHRQPLLALHHTAVLRAALPETADGAAVRRVLEALTVVSVPVDDRAAADVDTPTDLTRLVSDA